ncbi:unnamed protein product [Nippostrongylus brasiliensis]|uniref:Gag-pol polyprotein n=1 Tax=Nippostrongylus brasiliensis TaxID=27835 RepID=A0A0N4YGK1_NIPBR|nr:unnamed protein product [Nippostrongylus brasiliensis]
MESASITGVSDRELNAIGNVALSQFIDDLENFQQKTDIIASLEVRWNAKKWQDKNGLTSEESPTPPQVKQRATSVTKFQRNHQTQDWNKEQRQHE